MSLNVFSPPPPPRHINPAATIVVVVISDVSDPSPAKNPANFRPQTRLRMADELDHDPAKGRFLHSGCLSCCFPGWRREAADGGGGSDRRRLVRASSSWLRSRAQDIPELREKCRSLISRMGRRSGRRHPSDFRYDALSYSMNFDEGEDEALVGDFRYRNFSSRLAPTPPPASPAVEIVSCV